MLYCHSLAQYGPAAVSQHVVAFTCWIDLTETGSLRTNSSRTRQTTRIGRGLCPCRGLRNQAHPFGASDTHSIRKRASGHTSTNRERRQSRHPQLIRVVPENRPVLLAISGKQGGNAQKWNRTWTKTSQWNLMSFVGSARSAPHFQRDCGKTFVVLAILGHGQYNVVAGGLRRWNLSIGQALPIIELKAQLNDWTLKNGVTVYRFPRVIAR